MEKFQVKNVEELKNWEDNISLTPIDRWHREMEENMKKLNIENEKLVFKRQSKDRDDTHYMFGKVRNLENIIYLKPEDFKEIDNPLKLQMKLDSVTPKNVFEGKSSDEILNGFHNTLENYKLHIENQKKFRSNKEKLLGLPFLMNRLKQYPEPSPGTWQYDLFTKLYRQDYNVGKGLSETEEKINRYNYQQFLHPSIIEKFDTNSEEFDMYLRKLNYSSKTKKESKDQLREFFCKKYMGLLNNLNNEKEGQDVIYYLENKARNNQLDSYLFDNYSGHHEQKLFRINEEASLANRSSSNVSDIQYKTINHNRIGVKPEEINDLLNNPKKRRGKNTDLI